MKFKINLGSFQQLQQALAIAGLSLFASFLLGLFNARVRFIKLRKQGLVRSFPMALVQK